MFFVLRALTSADQILFLSTTTLSYQGYRAISGFITMQVQTQSTQFNAVSKGLTSSPVLGSEVFQVRVAGQKETLFFNCGLWEGHGACGG